MDTYQRLINTDSSSMEQDDLTSEEISIRKLAKSVLLNQIFMATYQERRYVQSLNDYRDVVRVHSDESDLLKSLKHVKKRIESHYQCWIGITDDDMTGAPVGTCLWVELPQHGKFGRYWFKIKSIKFKRNEITVKVKVLRDADTPDRNVVNVTTNSKEFIEQVQETIIDMLIITKTNLIAFHKEIFTIDNTRKALVYISALLVTLFIGAVHLLQYLGEYSLRLFREVSIFVKYATPIFLAIIDMVGKTFGSLFYLIYVLFRGNPKPQSYTYLNNQALGGASYSTQRAIKGPYVTQRAIPYHMQSNVRITEVN